MKKIFFSVSVLMLLIGAQSCKENAASRIKDEDAQKAKQQIEEAKDKLPVMTFENDTFEFGTVNEGDVVEATFKFKNTGNGDLIITKAKASCGCTVPEWPRNKRIKPGEEDVITAKFNTLHKRNNQSKTITLTTNTAKGKEYVKLKGFVTPDPKYDRKKSGTPNKIRPAGPPKSKR